MKTSKLYGLRKPSLNFRLVRSGKLALFAGLLLSVLSGYAQKAYITNSGDNTVSVVNLATNTVSATIPVGYFPFGVSVSPDGGTVVITHGVAFPGFRVPMEEGSISFINTVTNSVTGTLEGVYGVPGVCISPDGLKAYCAQLTGAVSEIDIATRSLTYGGFSCLEAPYGVAISPDGNKVYSANPYTFREDGTLSGFELGHTVTAFNRTTLAKESIEMGFPPFGLCLSSDGSTLYAIGDGFAAAVNTATNTIISYIDIPDYSLGIGICLSPDGSKLYLGVRSGTVYVVNTSTFTFMASISIAGGIQGISITPDGSKVVAVSAGHSPAVDNIYVINTATNTISATIPVGHGAYAFGNFIGPDPVVPCGENFTAVCHQQGLTHGGSPVPAVRSDASNTESAQKSDVQGAVNFYSLGFGGSVTLKSSCPVNNGEGNDIKVWETTYGGQPVNPHSDRARVFASQDGEHFRYLGMATYDGAFDLTSGGLAWAQYFRIVDATTDYTSNLPQADGFDVDGLEVLNGYINNVTPPLATNAAAASVCGGMQGKNKDFTPVIPIRSNPAKATGLPQNNDSFNFYSLGFGGNICLKFDYAVFDGPGGELQMVETTFGTSTCDQNKERAEVAVSYDGLNWTVLGEYCQDYAGTIDLTAANSGIQYVRVRDVSQRSDFASPNADGFDLDAVANVSTTLCGPAAARRAVNVLFDQTTVPEEIQGLQIRGNPVNDQVRLRFSMVTDQATVTITDHMGRRITTEQVTGNQWELKEITLPAAQLPAGVYFVTLDSDMQKETIPVIKN